MMSNLTPILFGLLSAFTWGAGDFSGGLATKRSSVYSVIIASQFVGAILLFGLTFICREVMPPIDKLVWGAIGGMSGALGIVCLYRALAIGRMGVAAPVSAVTAGVIPVIAGLFLQGSPKTTQVFGFGFALIGVWLISRSDDGAIGLAGLKLPFVAGIGFGFFLLLINRVSVDVIVWPLVAARWGSLTIILIYAAVTGQFALPSRDRLTLIALAGALDSTGNAFYALAGQIGRLDVAAVLSSLYPASTVGLARTILKERITRIQSIGIAAVLIAIVLITI